MNGSIFTIGYTIFGNDIDAFIALLKKNNINVLIDVRSSPYSSYYKQYDKENLERELAKYEIYYRNYAKEFGARQEDRSLYPQGYLDFELFSKTDVFLSGVNKIEQSIKKNYNVCFMCAEKEPVNCHRTILVARAFSDRGYEISHLLSDGSIKTQKDIEKELTCYRQGKISDDPNADIVTLAYRDQNEKIGYKLEDL